MSSFDSQNEKISDGGLLQSPPSCHTTPGNIFWAIARVEDSLCPEIFADVKKRGNTRVFETDSKMHFFATRRDIFEYCSWFKNEGNV